MVAGRLRGSRKRGPRPGDVGGSRWVFVRVRHHRLLRLASTLRVSVACAGQVNVFPAGVPDRQALLECVARPRVVRLYEGVLLGEFGSPGVVIIYGRFRSRWCDVHHQVLWWEEVIPRPPCRLLPCVWPVRDSRRACVAVRHCCSSCGRLRLRALGGFPRVAEGRCGGHSRFRAQGPRVPPGPPSQCEWRAAVARLTPAPGSGGSRCSITFPWSSARPWAPRVWLAWRTRFAGEEGQVERRVRVWRRSFLFCRRVPGVGEAWPPPGGCGRRSLGFCSCPTPRAAKASLYSLGVGCTCRAG